MAKARYAVQCDRHGALGDKRTWRAVFVGQPKSRKSGLHGGCPQCKAEYKAQQTGAQNG